MKHSTKIFLAALLALLSAPLLAHTGHAETGLVTGLLHPLTGLDHLFAAVAAGFWLSLKGASPRYGTALFGLALLTGIVLGALQLVTPMLEPMLAGSLLGLALLLVFRGRLPAWSGVSVIGVMAVLHGLAHGSEAGLTGTALFGYGAGILFTSIALFAVGYGIGRRSSSQKMAPLAAGILTAAGAFGLAG